MESGAYHQHLGLLCHCCAVLTLTYSPKTSEPPPPPKKKMDEANYYGLKKQPEVKCAYNFKMGAVAPRK